MLIKLLRDKIKNNSIGLRGSRRTRYWGKSERARSVTSTQRTSSPAVGLWAALSARVCVPLIFFSHPSVRVFLSFLHLSVRECVIIVVRGNNRTHGTRRRASRVQRLRWYLYINASQSLYYSTIVTVGLQISCYLGSNTRSIGNYVIAAITAISALLSSERVRERLKAVRAIEKRARTYAPLVRRVSKRRASITAVRNTISLIINNNYRRDRFVRAWFSVFVIISTRAAAVRVFFSPRVPVRACVEGLREKQTSPPSSPYRAPTDAVHAPRTV